MRTVLVTGAGRGLGLEFARQYAGEGWSVIATVRNEAAAEALRSVAGSVRIEMLDMRDFAAIARFAEQLREQPLDLLIANAGMTTPGAMRTSQEAERFLEVLAVNSVAPTLLASALAPNVIRAKGRLIAITSQMGSIADNGSGGWLAYRASKAALNAAWRTLAIDMAAEPVAIAMLHPGWVKTDMGGGGAPLEPAESVAAVRQIIDGLTSGDKGLFLNHLGETLPW
jgi:NAD(P)-dependent dehydrogenase (short-subunit alcohol dehydrogenase family)